MGSDLSVVDLEREMGLRGSLADFIRISWPVVEPGTPLVWNWHLDAMCEHLEALHRLEIKNLIINVPPGTGKSRTCGVFFPTWVWLKDPGLRFICAAYEEGLCIRDAREQLKLLQSEWWQARFPGKVVLPSNKVAEGGFHNVHGGFRYACSVGTGITGYHADYRIADDLLKAQGLTPLNLKKVQDFWTGAFSTRIKDPKTHRTLLIMQRLHDEDISGFCERTGEYTVLKLPMRYDPRVACYTNIGGDPRSKDGELLFPERFPPEYVAQKEKELGGRATAAQFQQNPVPDGGDIFKKEWFRTWDTAPDKWDLVIQSWDCAFKDLEDSDYVVGQVWGVKGPNFYLLDQTRARLSFTETCAAIRDMRRKWPQATAILIEDKANGSAVIDTLVKDIPGIIPITPEGGKVARANAVSPVFEAGNVWYPNPTDYPWITDHHSEMLRFPFGAFDDTVDACTQAINWLYQRMFGPQFAQAMENILGGFNPFE
jgi:predicted phage terminase large subunit-like protein